MSHIQVTLSKIGRIIVASLYFDLRVGELRAVGDAFLARHFREAEMARGHAHLTVRQVIGIATLVACGRKHGNMELSSKTPIFPSLNLSQYIEIFKVFKVILELLTSYGSFQTLSTSDKLPFRYL